jgi:hypothetical protein
MKQLFKNLWEGPASSFAGAITLALSSLISSGFEMPPVAIAIVGALAAMLSFFAGPQKPKLK